MAKVEMKRFSFSVPCNDTMTLAWLEAQRRKSFSIREVIKNQARKDGRYRDYFSWTIEEAEERYRERHNGEPMPYE